MGVDTEKEMDIVTRKVDRVFKVMMVMAVMVMMVIMVSGCKYFVVRFPFVSCHLRGMTVSVSYMI